MPRAAFRRRAGGDGRVFGRPPPEQGAGGAAADDLAVIADHSRPRNARFLAYQPGSGEPAAAIGDLYAPVLNQNVTAWRSAPAAVTVERTVLRWPAEAIGCEGFTGSRAGGSSANLMGLAMAREAKAACGCMPTASTAALGAPELFAGPAQADSISLDARKWLDQPLDCSARLHRDAGAARRAFADTGEHARPLSGDPVEGFAFFEEPLELSRPSRALKLWLPLRYHGQFRAAIRADLEHAQLLARLITAEPTPSRRRGNDRHRFLLWQDFPQRKRNPGQPPFL
jgi:glutamate/tyrosine decarboxylase-like PLP-dependent enzyme